MCCTYRYQIAGASEAVARYEIVALGRSSRGAAGVDVTTNSSSSAHEGQDALPTTSSSSSSLAGCSQGSAGAILLERPKESLDRLVSIWMSVDGTALPLLEPLGRLMADMAGACERMGGANPEGKPVDNGHNGTCGRPTETDIYRFIRHSPHSWKCCQAITRSCPATAPSYPCPWPRSPVEL